MSKTILANVDGFTPVIDNVADELGIMSAVVFGKAWRYCQMQDGVCKASQDRIANELGVSRATVNAHFSKLTKAGYLKDLTPELVGVPHKYADTGKANLSISFTGGVKKIDRLPVKKIDTKILVKDTNKEIKEAPAAKPRTPDEVLLFREVTERYPPKVNFEDVVTSISRVRARIGRAVTASDLKQFFAAWCSKGYKPNNLSWLEWAETGQVPKNGNWKPQRADEPFAFESIRQWLGKDGENGDSTGSGKDDSATVGGVHYLEA